MTSGGDPFSAILEQSAVHQMLKAARQEASLQRPTRPYTPLHDRSLFQHEISSRPSSAYSVPKLVRRPTLERFQPIHKIKENEPYVVLKKNPRHKTPSPPTTQSSSTAHVAEVLTLDDDGNSISAPSLEDAISDQEKDLSDESDEDVLVPVQPAAQSGNNASNEQDPRRPSKKNAWRQRFDQMCDTLWAFSVGDDEQYWELAPNVEDMVSEVLARNDGTPEILLRAVLFMLELTEARVLFRYCGMALKLLMVDRVVAQVSAAGIQSAFLNLMKALFKFSKVEGNDVHFLPLLPVLVQLVEGNSSHFLPLRPPSEAEIGPSPSPDATPRTQNVLAREALVFLLGALKNASLTSDMVQQEITKLGAIPKLLALCGEGNEEVGSAREAQVLIQVTGALRNLTSTPAQARQFLHHNGLSALTRISSLYSRHRELLLNISRVLSKLSLQPLVVQYLQDAEESVSDVRQVSRMLALHGEYAPLCVRLMFFLGNVTAKSERVRILFMFECDGASLIPSLLHTYWKMDRQLTLPQASQHSSAALEVEDVLTKVIRLLANLAISPSVGATAAATSAFVEPLLDILGCKKIQQSEELVLNAIGCATNLLFYDIPSNLLYLPENKELLCRLFRPLLLDAYNSEAVMEAARALGNLSRHESTRMHIRDLRIDEILGILLEHDDRDIVYYACGVLVNLASDFSCTARLASCGVPGKLATLMQEISWDDVDLNLCVVKVFTNLLLDTDVRWDPDVLSRIQNYLREKYRESSSRPGSAGSVSAHENDVGIIQRCENGSCNAPLNEKTDALRKLVGNLLNKLPTPRYCCPEDGCGRKFASEDTLRMHCERRHPSLATVTLNGPTLECGTPG
eukprot:GEMP01006329.1.p1 GENE.GEMP01006329.1~~GEMP01006329.1.p1  ORF type:complete len:855 (+),score=184.89 GEMP01006329.1:129-2693(+)